MRILMKLMLVTVFALASHQSLATTATVTNVFTAGNKIVASQMNTNFNDILGVVNGNLDSASNLAPGGIASASIASGVVNTDKLSDGAVTGAKIHEATIAQSKLSFVPQLSVATGSITAYGGTTAPDGWFLCNGASVSRVTYAGLFAVIGTNFGTGNGTTTFNIPDVRGLFLRGMDGPADAGAGGVVSGRDQDQSTRVACNNGDSTASSYHGNTGRAVGSCQSSDLVTHAHNISTDNAGSGVRSANNDGTSSGGSTSQTQRSHVNASGTNSTDPGAGIGYGDTGTGTETRPRNLYVNYIVKY